MSKNGKIHYDCTDCPAYCCSIYERVEVKKRDLKRLAKHFGVTEEVAAKRFTRMHNNEPVLRRKKDRVFRMACMFLDQNTRGCTIYNGRPQVCREYPDQPRCSYYDVLQFEREQQDDPKVIPLVQITFMNWKRKK